MKMVIYKFLIETIVSSVFVRQNLLKIQELSNGILTIIMYFVLSLMKDLKQTFLQYKQIIEFNFIINKIVDVPSLELIKGIQEGVVQFEWVYVQKYIYLTTSNIIYLYSLVENAPLHQIQADPGTCSFSLNHNSSLIATFSQQENNVKIWTFNETQHALEFLDENDIKFYTWSKASADGNGCIMTLITDNGIKIWDVEFGELKMNVDLKEEIMEYSILQGSKNQDLIVLFTEDQDKYKIWILDQMDKSKREISLNSHMESLIKLDDEELLVLLGDELMVFNIQKIDKSYNSKPKPQIY